MQKIAFLTMDSLEDFVAYDDLVHEPLGRRGWRVENVSWRAAEVRWDEYALVVIRSPWDYQQDPRGFMGVLQEIDASTRLQNSLQIVRWNIRKTYLRDLWQRGVSIVPTRWLDRLEGGAVERLRRAFGTDELVIKPLVGANADDTFRVSLDDRGALEAAYHAFCDREVMVQPFVPSVVDVGEYSLLFFGEDYSHCILKTPKTDDFRVQEEHGATIRRVSADAELKAAARDALVQTAAVVQSQPLYARVDFVRLDDGTPALMELELIEPSLYLAFDEHSPDRFADAIVRLLHGS